MTETSEQSGATKLPRPRESIGSLTIAVVLGVIASLLLSAIIYIFFVPPSSGRPWRVRGGEHALHDTATDLASEHKLKPDMRRAPFEENKYSPWWGESKHHGYFAIVPVLGHPDADTFEFYAVTDYNNYPTLYLRINREGKLLEERQIGPFAEEKE